MTDLTNKPLAAPGLDSYRYKGRYGWIMIGANSYTDALREAERSFSGGGTAVPEKLEKWNGEKYVPVVEVTTMYGHDEVEGLDAIRIDHVAAMTGEGLRNKSSIANELAYRDARIEYMKRKIISALIAHPNAVETLLNEALSVDDFESYIKTVEVTL